MWWRLSHSRPPLLASWVRVNVGTAVRNPNSAVNTSSAKAPPPNPATADSHASPNTASAASATDSNSSVPPLSSMEGRWIRATADQSRNASLIFSPACFTSAEAWSALP